jgi:hypothetical protein
VLQVFTVQVLPAEGQWPTFEVLFNGKPLPGTPEVHNATVSATGPSELLDLNSVALKDKFAGWEITSVCLTPEPQEGCAVENAAKVLVVRLLNSHGDHHSRLGFTLSYTTQDVPQILRFSLFSDEEAVSNLDSAHWHSPYPRELTLHGSGAHRLQADTSSITHITDPALVTSIPTTSTLLLPVWTSTFSSSNHGVTTARTQPSVPQATLHGQHHGQQALSKISNLPTLEQLAVNTENAIIKENSRSASLKDRLSTLGDKTKVAFKSIGKKFSHAPCSTAYAVSLSSGLYVLGPESVSDTAPPSANGMTSSSRTRVDQGLRAFQITSLIVVLVVASGAVFAFLIRDPRRKVDRLARREERRNYCLYQQAVYQQRVKSWYYKVRGIPFPGLALNVSVTEPTTWEEKRELALRQDQAARSALREELYALRNAHRVVDGLIGAEEGRPNFSYSCVRRTDRRERRERREIWERRNSEARSDRTGPPLYAECDARDATDHFAFVAFDDAPAAKDNTPDSSVIDTSPRNSVYMDNSDSERLSNSDSEKE